MNKEPQIEEIIGIMSASNDPFVDVPIEIMSKVAEVLYNAGYRKLPEDSVVLSREEYDSLRLQIQQAHNKGVQAGFDLTIIKQQSIRKQAVKEFAEKLKKKVHNYYPSIDSYCTSRHVILVKDIDELLKEYE